MLETNATKDADGDGKIDEADKAAEIVDTGPVDADGDGKINEDEDPPKIARARTKLEREYAVYQKKKASAQPVFDAYDKARAEEKRLLDESNQADEDYSAVVRKLDEHEKNGGDPEETERLRAEAFEYEEKANAAEKEWQKAEQAAERAEAKADRAAPNRDRLENALNTYHEAQTDVAEARRADADGWDELRSNTQDEIDSLESERDGLEDDDPARAKIDSQIDKLQQRKTHAEKEYVAADSIASFHERRAKETGKIMGVDQDPDLSGSFEDFTARETERAEKSAQAILTGPKGGRYYIGPSGERVYVD